MLIVLFIWHVEIAACCRTFCRINSTYAKLWWPYGDL